MFIANHWAIEDICWRISGRNSGNVLQQVEVFNLLDGGEVALEQQDATGGAPPPRASMEGREATHTAPA
jgi:hypothetical protein